MYKFQIGADPEVFCGDASGVRSVIGKIGGSKAQPLPLPIGEGFAVQEDNVALEFNIPASASKADFVANIARATGYLERMVQDKYGFSFVKESAVSFPQKELNTPAALVFGCDPDYNAWTFKRNPRPRAKDRNLRSCGGHIHIGNTDVDPISLIRACDLFLGVPSVLMDKGSLRRSLYGKAGAFRKKDYGAEYRTLSNFWVFDKRLTEWAYDNTNRALGWALEGVSLDTDREAILASIDEGNVDATNLLVRKYNLEVVHHVG